MLYKYLTTMKKILFTLLFLNSILCFSQKNFTMAEFNLITDNGQKWNNNIKIFIYGDCSFSDSVTIVKTITEFNSILETVQIELVDDISLSNTVMYFTTDNDFIKLFPWSEKDVKNSTGITYTNVAGKKITKVRLHIDITECRKYSCMPITIRHEMFHILGFGHIENEENTILKSRSEEFSERDKEMISLLYKK